MKGRAAGGNHMPCAGWPGVHLQAGTEPKTRAAVATDKTGWMWAVTEEDCWHPGLAGCLQGKPKERQGAQRYWDKVSGSVRWGENVEKEVMRALNMMNVKAVMMYFSLSHENTPCSPKETLVIISKLEKRKCYPIFSSFKCHHLYRFGELSRFPFMCSFSL